MNKLENAERIVDAFIQEQLTKLTVEELCKEMIIQATNLLLSHCECLNEKIDTAENY